MVGLKGDLLLLRLYGHWDRAFPAAQHVASVPWMNWGQFEVLRMIVHDVRWAAAREGDMDSVAKLGEHAFDDDYRPLFMEKEGLPFKRPLDDPKLRRSLGLDPSPGSFILPPPNRITPFLNDLSLLAMIWAYGGSSRLADGPPRARACPPRSRPPRPAGHEPVNDGAFTQSVSREMASILAAVDRDHASAIDSTIDPTSLNLLNVALSIAQRSAKSVSFANPTSMTDRHN